MMSEDAACPGGVGHRASRRCRWRSSTGGAARAAPRAHRSLAARGERGRARLRLPGADRGDDPQLGQAGPHPAGRRRPSGPTAFHEATPALAATAFLRARVRNDGKRPLLRGPARSSATASWSASARSRPPGRAATSSCRWAPTRTSAWCARSSRDEDHRRHHEGRTRRPTTSRSRSATTRSRRSPSRSPTRCRAAARDKVEVKLLGVQPAAAGAARRRRRRRAGASISPPARRRRCGSATRSPAPRTGSSTSNDDARAHRRRPGAASRGAARRRRRAPPRRRRRHRQRRRLRRPRARHPRARPSRCEQRHGARASSSACPPRWTPARCAARRARRPR